MSVTDLQNYHVSLLAFAEYTVLGYIQEKSREGTRYFMSPKSATSFVISQTNDNCKSEMSPVWSGLMRQSDANRFQMVATILFVTRAFGRRNFMYI